MAETITDFIVHISWDTPGTGHKFEATPMRYDSPNEALTHARAYGLGNSTPHGYSKYSTGLDVALVERVRTSEMTIGIERVIRRWDGTGEIVHQFDDDTQRRLNRYGTTSQRAHLSGFSVRWHKQNGTYEDIDGLPTGPQYGRWIGLDWWNDTATIYEGQEHHATTLAEFRETELKTAESLSLGGMSLRGHNHHNGETNCPVCARHAKDNQ